MKNYKMVYLVFQRNITVDPEPGLWSFLFATESHGYAKRKVAEYKEWDNLRRRSAARFDLVEYEVRPVYVYDENGEPIEENTSPSRCYVYDENGEPIEENTSPFKWPNEPPKDEPKKEGLDLVFSEFLGEHIANLTEMFLQANKELKKAYIEALEDAMEEDNQ